MALRAANGRDQLTVLFVETDDWAFAKHRIDLGRAALAAGYRVVVAAPQTEWAAGLVEEGFEFFPIPLNRSSSNPFREIGAILALTRIYREVRPDIAHHVALKAIIYGSVAARMTRVPSMVNYITGLGYMYTGDDLHRRFLRYLISPALAIALRGKRVRNIFENVSDLKRLTSVGLVDARLSIVGHGAGVDMERFKPTPEPPGDPVVLLASRLLWDKGVGELVDAVRMLKSRGLLFRTVVAGRPDPENPASLDETTLRGWETEGLIEWVGYVDDVPALLAESHIACLPSYREGLPVALVEAAAAGRPIVATDVPGCRDVVDHGVNGLLVPPRDGAALASALETLIRDPGLRLRMGASGREKAAESHSSEVVIAEVFDVWNQLVPR